MIDLKKKMQYLNVLHILVYVLCLNQKGFSQCRINLCLTWRVSKNNLTLVCKAGSLFHKVLIIDPTGHLQADCLPPSPEVHCDPFYRNGTISQNPRTNETTYVVRGKIDKTLNGVWACRHGRQKYVANVEVTIFESEERDCMKEILAWTSTAVVSFAVIACIAFIAVIKRTRSKLRTYHTNVGRERTTENREEGNRLTNGSEEEPQT